MDISVIDPVLRPQEAGDYGASANGVIAPHVLPIPPVPPNTLASTSWSASNFAPRRDPHPPESQQEYESRLCALIRYFTPFPRSSTLLRANENRKAPLVEACGRLGIHIPKKNNLARLCAELIKHWHVFMSYNLHSLSFGLIQVSFSCGCPQWAYSPHHRHRLRPCRPTSTSTPTRSRGSRSSCVRHRSSRASSCCSSPQWQRCDACHRAVCQLSGRIQKRCLLV